MRKLAEAPGQAVWVLVSPKGDQIVFNGTSAQEIYIAPLTSSVASATLLPGVEIDGRYFGATDWSKDGLRLAGQLASASNLPTGVGVYDIAGRKTTVLSNDTSFAVRWLSDGRRVVYFTDKGARLVVLDTVTRARTLIDVTLPGPSIDDMFAISPDNRTIYYGAARSEADIWIVERK